MGSMHNLVRGSAFVTSGNTNNGNQTNLSGRSPSPSPSSSNNLFGGRNTPNSFSHFAPPRFQQQRQMNLMSSSNAAPGSGAAGFPAGLGRNPLFSRDRKLGDSILSPNTFDPSEFPSLGQNSAPNPSLSARPNYVGMVEQPAMESSEFTMSHEDFPALPGSAPSGAQQSQQGPHSGSTFLASHDRMTSQGLHQDNSGMGVGSAVSIATSQQKQQHEIKKGIQTSPEGSVKNIPSSMVMDQFGMIGLLTFIRAAETDPNLVSLALGTDLTTLGLGLNSEVNLYPTFGGPWADTPCRPQDIDFHVPHEYLTNQSIREKLAPVKLNRYKDDVLFYMFYTNVGDVLQLAAAAELYNRDWRYHRDDRVWITRAPGMAPSEKTPTYERGTYYFFDVTNWRKVPKEFHLDYDKLEDRPSLPQSLGSGMSSGPPPPSASSNNVGNQMSPPLTSNSMDVRLHSPSTTGLPPGVGDRPF